MNFYIVTYINEKDENKNAVDISTQLDSLETVYEFKKKLEILNQTTYDKITMKKWHMEIVI